MPHVFCCVFQSGFFSPPPSRSAMRLFSSIYCENLMQFIEGPRTRSLWSLRLSDSSTLRLQRFIDYSAGFPAPAPVPTDGAAKEFLLQRVGMLCIRLPASPTLGAATVLCPHFYDGYKKRVDDFSVFSAFSLLLVKFLSPIYLECSSSISTVF